MKLKLITGVLALSLATSVFADVTIDITGATAFRAAALETIKAKYVASGQPFKYAHDQVAGSFNGATYSIFIGTFQGVTGNTTIRTSFKGSVEGIRAITQSPTHDREYLLASVLDGTTAIDGGAELALTSSPKAAAQAEFAFSDVSIASTPYGSYSVLPADARVGVVVFAPLVNEGAPASLTNISSKQFQALFARGYQPLSLLTGNATDDSNYVFATGRNDGSGTRTVYMAETGLGIRTLVQQYVRGATSGDTITQIHRVPMGGISASIPGSAAANKSSVWNQDVAGNGGYDSGSTLQGDFGKTSAACAVLDADGSTLLAAGDSPLNLLTMISLNDALPARVNGARILGYNGVRLDDIAASGTTMSDSDKEKVTRGAYTAWSYQQLYRRGDIATGDAVTVYDGLKNAIPDNLAAAGLTLTEMSGIGREVDGGPVTP